MANAQHSNSSQDHGTPAEVVALARHALGDIGTDPCSDAYWNHYTVKAKVFWSKADDGLVRPWAGTVLCNPPGGESDKDPATGKRRILVASLVRPFWERLCNDWRAGLIDGALWVNYSLEMLCLLQGSPCHPLQLPTVVPCERLRYLRRPEGGGPPKSGTSPTHASALTLLPSRRDPALAKRQLSRFVELGSKLGALVRPF